MELSWSDTEISLSSFLEQFALPQIVQVTLSVSTKGFDNWFAGRLCADYIILVDVEFSVSTLASVFTFSMLYLNQTFVEGRFYIDHSDVFATFKAF